MLANHFNSAQRQRGVVLFFTVILLVAMTMAGIALTRSVDTANVIAGNLAFHDSTILASDVGIESAIDWLDGNAGATLNNDAPAAGYAATGLGAARNPAAGQSWDSYWTTVLEPSGQARTLPMDTVTGTTVSYVINRLCTNLGPPTAMGTGCAVAPSNSQAAAGNGSKDPDTPDFSTGEVYYRITARTVGPHNTVTYTQAIVRVQI